MAPESAILKRLRPLAVLSVFLFPALVATVSYAGSILFAMLTLIGLIGGFRGWKSLSIWEKRMLMGMVLLACASVLSLVNAQDLSNGLSRMEKLYRLIALIPMFLAIRRMKADLARPFYYGCLVAGPLMLSVSLYDILGKGMERSAGVYHPIVLGDLAIVVVSVLGAALLSGYPRRSVGPLTVLSLLAALVASGLTGSRGGWIALAPLLVLYLWLERRRLGRWPVVAVLLVSLIGGGVITATYNPIRDRVEQAFTEVADFSRGGDVNTSVGSRLALWRLAIGFWRENPVFGSGLGDFQQDVRAKMAAGKTGLEIAWPHAHSIYFEYLATTGIFGTCAMLWALVIAPVMYFFAAIKTDEKTANPITFLSLAGLGSVLCFAVFGLSETWTARMPLVSSYVVCLLVFASSTFPDAKPDRQ